MIESSSFDGYVKQSIIQPFLILLMKIVFSRIIAHKFLITIIKPRHSTVIWFVNK